MQSSATALPKRQPHLRHHHPPWQANGQRFAFIGGSIAAGGAAAAAAMANWISSKLKVAETLLQQIDQQAAESLGKNNEKPPQQSPSSSSFDSKNEIPKKQGPLPPPPPPPLKYQLPQKNSPSQYHRSPSPSAVPPPTLPYADPPAIDDWTELLSSPNPPTNKKPPHFKKPFISIPPVLNKKEKEKYEKKEEKEESGCSSSGSEESGTDSEEEREREERWKRREQIIKEKAAAAAAQAIKDREDAVARLEGEKLSLEKLLGEREKQQAHEATELQMNMIEAMEAVELEKLKHNSTRMEAFARLAKLETTNAELAKSLATAQWNLEMEVNRILELQQQIELKERAQEEHKRRVLKSHQKHPSSNKEELLSKNALEQEVLDAEYSFMCNEIAQLKDKAKIIEENIERTRRECLYPSEVEVELKRRLTQLTDHLIQKQSQVESLSSEKATLLLRIEMVSRLLDESGVSLQATCITNDSSVTISSSAARFDIEAATWQRPSKSQALHERIRSGRIRLGSLVHQLDVVFSAGSIFIGRNRKAQLWSLLYILCLHIWVVYILFSPHSKVSDNPAGNGAVFSLEI